MFVSKKSLDQIIMFRFIECFAFSVVRYLQFLPATLLETKMRIWQLQMDRLRMYLVFIFILTVQILVNLCYSLRQTTNHLFFSTALILYLLILTKAALTNSCYYNNCKIVRLTICSFRLRKKYFLMGRTNFLSKLKRISSQLSLFLLSKIDISVSRNNHWSAHFYC